jgi:predicted polyphosphate/ATP-dependent NAD kinase
MRSSLSPARRRTSLPQTSPELAPLPVRGATRPRLGIIVNPLAGIGGAVALKGSDGPQTVARAFSLGGVPQAPARTTRTLRALAATAGPLSVLTAPGTMGADLALESGFEVTTTGPAAEGVTSALDTRAAALAMRDAGVDLLLFAGGDGTARDIYDAVGMDLPLLGIPAGVKMHSGVFAPSPEAAAQASDTFLRAGPAARLRAADIADVDEHAARAGRVASVLHGSARVPDLPRLVLPAKAGSRTSPVAALDALCRKLAAELEPGCLYLIGPGSTTAAVLAAAGHSGALLGVDAVCDGQVVGRDLTERQITTLIQRHQRVRLLVGLIGGQGALFGRGNRQIGPSVLRRIARDRIIILSAADKLLALNPSTLWVDTGDPELDAQLCGYIRVHVGPQQQIVINVSR